MPQRLVCFGDSITQGTIGASYVKLLTAQLPAVQVINAGSNGDTVVNLLRRVERDVIRVQPDVVMIQVGLNDIGTAYGSRLMRGYYRAFKQVWRPIPPATFTLAYRSLLQRLRPTGARIILCTPTTLGENPTDPWQAIVDAYAHVVRGLAWQAQLPLVDLRAAFWDAIQRDPRDGPSYQIWTPLSDAAAIALRRIDYPQLSVERGYRLLCDGVHLAPPGAALVAATALPVVQTALVE